MSSVEMVSSLAICPINFNAYQTIQKHVSNIDAIVLLSKIKFHYTNSRIDLHGHKWIARTRSQLSAWFGYSERKIDRLLTELIQLNLITKKTGLWYGEKKLFLAPNEKILTVPINHKLFTTIQELTGSVSATIIYSKIAFAFANTKLQHDNKKWCCLKEQELATVANISLRTLDKIIEQLQQKNLLIKKKYNYKGSITTHYHIPYSVIKNILTLAKASSDNNNEFKNKTPNTQIYQPVPANLSLSIKKRINTKETSNNNTKTDNVNKIPHKNCDINFEPVTSILTPRQYNYVVSSLKRTINSFNLPISNIDTILKEIIFSITNLEQHKTATKFTHIVSRCMKILANRNWKTPIGFYKYSETGKIMKQLQENRELEWQRNKEDECAALDRDEKGLKNIADILIKQKPQENIEKITEKALKLANKIVDISKNKEHEDLFEHLMVLLTKSIKEGADIKKIQTVLCLPFSQ